MGQGQRIQVTLPYWKRSEKKAARAFLRYLRDRVGSDVPRFMGYTVSPKQKVAGLFEGVYWSSKQEKWVRDLNCIVTVDVEVDAIQLSEIVEDFRDLADLYYQRFDPKQNGQEEIYVVYHSLNVILTKKSDFQLRLSDLVEPTTLAKRLLNDNGSACAYLRGRMCEQVKSLLNGTFRRVPEPAKVPGSILVCLVAELNRVINGSSLSQEPCFGNTERLLGQTALSSAEINRRLLESVFTVEISPFKNEK